MWNLQRALVAGALASIIAYKGYKKQSLDVSGALAGLFVCFFSMASGYRFGM